MTITATLTQSNVALNQAFGRHLDDAATPAAKAITVGFSPSYVQWVNLTDRITYEWYAGMANGTTVKTVAAGTRTLDTTDVAISVASTATGTAPVQEKGTFVVTIGAAAILQNKQYTFAISE